MTINSLKDLKQVIKALRDGGVTSAEIDGVKLTLLPKDKVKQPLPDYSGDIPEAHIPVPRYSPVENPTPEAITTDELTEEQRMFWSSVEQ